MNLNVRVGGTLGEFVSRRVGKEGAYENLSEYVRDLIRRDKESAEHKAFLMKKAELQQAFSAPDSDYGRLSADDTFARNAIKS